MQIYITVEKKDLLYTLTSTARRRMFYIHTNMYSNERGNISEVIQVESNKVVQLIITRCRQALLVYAIFLKNFSKMSSVTDQKCYDFSPV